MVVSGNHSCCHQQVVTLRSPTGSQHSMARVWRRLVFGSGSVDRSSSWFMWSLPLARWSLVSPIIQSGLVSPTCGNFTRENSQPPWQTSGTPTSNVNCFHCACNRSHRQQWSMQQKGGNFWQRFACNTAVVPLARGWTFEENCYWCKDFLA